jgi:uncharacterized protein
MRIPLLLLAVLSCQNVFALRIAPWKTDSTNVKVKGGELVGVLTTSTYTRNAKQPLVIIIAGSGPTDMNGNSPAGVSANSYAMLAQEFAQRGIATYRYDKRGIALSADLATKEDDLNFEDAITDVKAIITTFKTSNQFSKIIILGHSEGSLVGMIAARSGADKYISLAGSADNAADLLKVQLANSFEGKEKTKIFKQLDSLKKGMTVRDEDPKMQMLFRKSVQPYMKSWFKYTPTAEIKKLKIPVLIVNGTKDIQVSEDNAKKLKKANAKAQLLIVENMNHVLKTVETDERDDNLATYSNEFLPVVYEAVEKISEFVKK